MSKKKSKEKVVEFSKLTNKVAAVWTRVSTERQADTNGSLESQRRICTEYAESHAIRIKKYYGGTNESAKVEGKLYREMIAEVARDKEINIILVYSFDRFSRAGYEAMMTKAYLKAKGIYVVSATQATDQIVRQVDLWKMLSFFLISLRITFERINVSQVWWSVYEMATGIQNLR